MNNLTRQLKQHIYPIPTGTIIHIDWYDRTETFKVVRWHMKNKYYIIDVQDIETKHVISHSWHIIQKAVRLT